MRNLLAILVLFGPWSGSSAFAQVKQDTADEMASQFAAPPDSARPWVNWIWLDGNITREGITADLEAMRRVGIGGMVLMEVDQKIPKGPVRFGSPKWREMFQHTVAEAGRLGLEVDMNNDAGWCGSGGPWITPELAMQKLVGSEMVVEGPKKFHAELPRPPAPPPPALSDLYPPVETDYYRDIAVLAFPVAAGNTTPQQPVNRQKVQDLTARLEKDGRLSWDVPPGKWTLLRLGYAPTRVANHPAPREGLGLESDKFSKEATDAHFAGLMAKLIADVGPAAGKTLAWTHVDSWECHSQDWTPRMREEFTRRRGYDPLPLLPAMIGRTVDSPDVSARFLWDMRKTGVELFNENYAGRLQELAHRHGMRLTIEAYGDGPFDELSYAGRADRPMGEFWVGFDSPASTATLRFMASAAHTYGKNVVAAESFTGIPEASRWKDHPFSLKPLGDAAFCMGVNHIMFHRYAHQPWTDRKPGMTMGPFGVHYERTETWWEHTRPWHQYLARCSYLLRQGLFVADVCCLQEENVHRSGYGLDHVFLGAYEFDGCSPEVVLTRMSVRDGRLVLPDGMSYRLLVLPPSTTMTPELLGKIKELVQAGATVIGQRPDKSPSLCDYPRCDAKVQTLAAELWGNCDGKTVTEHRSGRGKVVWGKTPETVLAEMGVRPDFRYKARAESGDVRYIHRTTDGTDLYFVAASSPKATDLQCVFRVKGKRPEFWHPDTGRIERVAAYDQTDEGTHVPIALDPCGSVFVVFRADGATSPDRVVAISGVPRATARFGEDGRLRIEAWKTGRYDVKMASGRSEHLEVAALPEPFELSGPWELRFPRGWGAPERVTLGKLISWTRHPDAGVKYFSGTATYIKSFQIPDNTLGANRRQYLDLGRVEVIAAVKLNGKPLGIVWKPPFRVDVTHALKAGPNELEIQVVNLWPNRLIGDEHLPEDRQWGPPYHWAPNAWGGEPLVRWPQWLLDGKPSPTGRFTFATWRFWTKDSPLLESGLLGPVRLLVSANLEVSP
jgi:hypothetical protein